LAYYFGLLSAIAVSGMVWLVAFIPLTNTIGYIALDEETFLAKYYLLK
jgi:hypothetical protein